MKKIISIIAALSSLSAVACGGGDTVSRVSSGVESGGEYNEDTNSGTTTPSTNDSAGSANGGSLNNNTEYLVNEEIITCIEFNRFNEKCNETLNSLGISKISLLEDGSLDIGCSSIMMFCGTVQPYNLKLCYNKDLEAVDVSEEYIKNDPVHLPSTILDSTFYEDKTYDSKIKCVYQY